MNPLYSSTAFPPGYVYFNGVIWGPVPSYDIKKLQDAWTAAQSYQTKT